MPGYRFKRVFDLTVVVVTVPVWVPLLVGVSAVVRIGLGRGVFFRQTRPGLNERSFEMIKFRTMTSERDASGVLLPDHARLTPLGRFLRSTSLDELPELINVLRGEMSLVGPRPLLVQYLTRYSARHRRRHAVPPGITGLVQVSGRNALSWTEKLELDIQYVEQCTFALDLSILARTIGAVVRRRGISATGSPTMPEFTGYLDSEGRGTTERNP